MMPEWTRKLQRRFGRAAPLPVAAPVAEPPPPVPYTLGNTQVRSLPSSAADPKPLLYVGLPYSYYQKPQRRYPVVYACDGYWHFPLLCALYSGLVSDAVVPEFIIIGLGYAGTGLNYDRLRQRDLAPTRVSLLGPQGGGAAYFELLRTEIMPLVDREYRTDPARQVIAGTSLGGLFGLFAMLQAPGLFSGCIAVSPSVGVGHDWIFRFEAAQARRAPDLPLRLYLTAGGLEDARYVASIRRFEQQLAGRQRPGLVHEFRVIDGERHSTTIPEAFNRGLRFVFETPAAARR